MHRMSFVAGAAVAFIVSAAGWSVLQSAPVAPAAADKTLGMALMSAVVNQTGSLVRGSGAVSAEQFGLGSYDVRFERSVTDCALSVTLASIDSSTTYYGWTLARGRIPKIQRESASQ